LLGARPDAPANEARQPDTAASWDRAIVCLILALVCFRASLTVADPDLWGHVRFGQDIIAAGRVPEADSYSYLTQGRRWINHEWLAEVLFALVFNALGPAGLVLLKTGVGLLTLGFVYLSLRRAAGAALGAAIFFLPVLLLCLPGLNTARPHLFTYLGFTILMLLIGEVERGRRRALWAAPPLFILWVNLHGGFLAGLGILIVWATLHLFTLILQARRATALDSAAVAAVVLPVALSVLAVVINPYGLELPRLLLRTATVPRPEIAEWAPLALFSLDGVVYLLLLAIALWGLTAGPRPHSVALDGVILCLTAAPLVAVRHLPLFAIGVAILAGEHIFDAPRTRLPGLAAVGAYVPGKRWLCVLPFLAAAGLLLASLPHFRCIRIDRATGFDFPVRAVGLLQRSGAHGNLAVHFDWGEYVIWYLGPDIKVSIDGRRETLYDDAIYEENVRFRLGEDHWDALIDRPETDFALASKRFPVFERMQRKDGWLLIYEDSVCGLFMRMGSSSEMALRAARPPDLPADGDGLCFP
jgi:hypothetical protein